jgi:hypothetical protein
MLHKGKEPHNPELFDSAEATIMSAAMIALSKYAPNDAAILSKRITQLQILNKTVFDSPSLSSQETLGGVLRSPQSLVQHLTMSDGLIGDLDLPVKATLQRSFLLAKIQLFRGLVKAISVLCKQDPDAFKPLAMDLREEMAQSIYTQMAEDLLLALLRKPTVTIPTKRRAARQLIQIWDNATVEIDDFCPLLESAWHARNRVNPGLGSLLGTTEYFRLVAEDCSDRFLDFFARDGVSEAENQAFAEFLFGLTWDELETLRNEMKRQKIDVSDEAWAEIVLGRRLDHDCDDGNNIDPIALYRSYTRRQLAADYRIVSGKPGPRRTAESYLMIYLLNNQSDLATVIE